MSTKQKAMFALRMDLWKRCSVFRAFREPDYARYVIETVLRTPVPGRTVSLWDDPSIRNPAMEVFNKCIGTGQEDRMELQCLLLSTIAVAYDAAEQFFMGFDEFGVPRLTEEGRKGFKAWAKAMRSKPDDDEDPSRAGVDDLGTNATPVTFLREGGVFLSSRPLTDSVSEITQFAAMPVRVFVTKFTGLWTTVYSKLYVPKILKNATEDQWIHFDELCARKNVSRYILAHETDAKGVTWEILDDFVESTYR